MAGHSHWVGIKHKKARADKERSKIFSKLSREITVAAKLGDKDPGMNPRLRTAIQAPKQANMPKENINRAINKSKNNLNNNYQSLRYEGFGVSNTALIIEALTDNKNRTASNIRTVLQKNGGRLGASGSTSHLFYNCGVIQFNKNFFKDDQALELAIDAGAKECVSNSQFHEIICEKKDFYKVKSIIEKKVDQLLYSAVEWRSYNNIDLSDEDKSKALIMLNTLDEIDDIQSIYINCKF